MKDQFMKHIITALWQSLLYNHNRCKINITMPISFPLSGCLGAMITISLENICFNSMWTLASTALRIYKPYKLMVGKVTEKFKEIHAPTRFVTLTIFFTRMSRSSNPYTATM